MGDKRPVARSGKNEGAVDFTTGQTPQEGQGLLSPGTAAPIRQCRYLDRIATLKDAFTPEECNQIINDGLNDWIKEEAKIQKDKPGEIEQNFEDDFDYRNVTLFIPPPTKSNERPHQYHWLFDKILGVIMNFNNNLEGYQFTFHGLAEPPNLMRYQAPDINPNGKAGKYDWHMDVGPGPVPSMRKISYSLLLNPGEYEGGELCFHIGRNLDIPHPGQDTIGSLIVFPSYLVHKVTPVTKGTRYAIVGWAHGNSFI